VTPEFLWPHDGAHASYQKVVRSGGTNSFREQDTERLLDELFRHLRDAEEQAIKIRVISHAFGPMFVLKAFLWYPLDFCSFVRRGDVFWNKQVFVANVRK
tara:strand:- start:23991 stop:24290 length:300 start_codon:yes stop_codon:yes gene_type:complete